MIALFAEFGRVDFLGRTSKSFQEILTRKVYGLGIVVPIIDEDT